jgi:copper resistance protein B
MSRLHLWSLLILGSAAAHAQETHEHHHPAAPVDSSESAAGHVPPAPPTETMHPMSPREMVDIMAMDDQARYGKFTVNEAEVHDDAFSWDIDAWYGSDNNKLWIKSEGDLDDGQHFDIDLLWDHVFARWWSVQSGVRRESRDGPNSEHDESLVLGLQGLAPQWFEVEARVYLDEHGGVTLHTKADYELLLTQRLVLQPEVKLTVTSRDNIDLGVGSGVSELEMGLRLRYEIRREFAPYVGIGWVRNFGTTADLTRSRGGDSNTLQGLAGLRFWF